MSVQPLPETAVATSVLHPRQPNLRQRILVVDDDPDIRRINSQVLTLSGYEVDAATDGAAAWDLLQMSHYDLLLTDNDMPKVTGVELIQNIHAAGMALPAIMVTAALPEHSASNKLQRPVEVLLKPYSVQELIGVVKAVLFASNAGREEAVPPPNWKSQPPSDRIQL